MVYLVGAGPGDPGLMTIRALELLRTADVVFYDRLINPALLAETKSGCTLVDVGKSAGKHTKSQTETINLLIEHGHTGKAVVRLKGGDPYLFGRGAEEAERLKEEGIPFAVVPGISALTAVTAYAGIPITHRDFASTFGVATGHGAKGKTEDPVRWREMAKAVDTLVVFMGVGSIDTITDELKLGGLDGDTPAAVIERGTTPHQRTVTGTVDTIAENIRRENVKPPALLVVGKTAALPDKLSWYEPGPLGGLSIGITRPLAQSKAFVDRLGSLGAQAIPMPTINTHDMIDTKDAEQAIKRLATFDWIVFSSVNGVESFFRALKKYDRDARALAYAKTACIGPVTGEALERHCIRPDITAERFVAEGLAEAILAGKNPSGKSFLLVRSNIGRKTLEDELTAAGAIVTTAVFYETRDEELSAHMKDIVQSGEIDIVTFTSSSTVKSFFAQIAPETVDPSVKLASIGPQTTKTIGQYGLKPDIEAKEYTTAGLTEAILNAWGCPEQQDS